VATDAAARPRYWATVWSDVLAGDISESTRRQNLSAIERLYRVAEALPGSPGLDRLIADMNFDTLEAALGGLLTEFRNEAKGRLIDRNIAWRIALRFVENVMSHLSPAAEVRVADLAMRIERLNRLYARLAPMGPRPPKPIRALPAVVVEDLYEIFNPQSPRNPFKTASQRWRNYMIFLMMLHLGLRSGELLILPTNAIHEGFDFRAGEHVRWINITTLDDREDPRSSRPSIKTATSHRQLPVSLEIVRIVDLYTMNYRGKPRHPFLVSSQKSRPLAKQTLADIFNGASEALSDSALKILKSHGKSSVTPHDLRHTAAVVRLTKYRNSGLDLDTSVEKLRAYFGWSAGSAMPRHYARAYFESTLADVWNDSFDSFVASLRQLGSGPK